MVGWLCTPVLRRSGVQGVIISVRMYIKLIVLLIASTK